LCQPKLVELVKCSKHDAICLDQEHVGLSIAQIEEAGPLGAGGSTACPVDRD
jgi:2-keto-3-deoxy-L-rhamnonate aldolase RhmA